MRTVLMSLCLLSTQALAIDPFSATFDVSRNNKALGTMEMTLRETSPGSFEFASRTEGTEGMAGFLSASIEERSQLQRGAAGYATTRYRYQQKMVGRKRERSLDVAADGAIAEREKDDRWSYRASNPVLDRHAAVLGVAEKLADGANVGSVLSIDVALRGEVSPWRFLVVGHETIQTGSGKIATIRVERVRDNPNRKTVSWHAPSYQYLPVKVEQTEPDGETMASVLKRFVPANAPARPPQ
mgnify:FL=1